VAGTTTILFTDLAGSSALLAAVGDDGYAATFGEHVATIRAPIEAHGGRIEKLLGDGVLALFTSAYDAARAAVGAQQAVDLAGRRGGATGLRIGIAVGEVVEAEDDVFGSALVVARRLCDDAEPGQILASDLVAALIGSRADVQLTPLGPRELAGIPAPVPTFGLAWEPLPQHAPLRVVVADDAPLIRSGVVRLLGDAGFVVTAEVGDGDELVAAVDRDPPDLVVTDVRMPPTNTDEGLVAAAAIRARHPAIGILVLSQYVEVASAAGLFAPGAAGTGYLLKERVSDIDEFVAACRQVVGGGSVVDPTVTGALLNRRRSDDALERLSERERDVLDLMAQGKSNLAIGEALFVGAKTVESHVRQIFQKLDLEDRPEGNRRVQAVITWLQRA
jgi:DNA-binding NarL/FixJ family response regulator/class 3 adenylate cyclase